MLQMYKVYLKENAFSTRTLFRKMLILEQRLNSSLYISIERIKCYLKSIIL